MFAVEIWTSCAYLIQRKQGVQSPQNPEMSGKFDTRRNSQGIFLRAINFQPIWERKPPDPLNGLGHIKQLIVVWQSQGNVREFHPFWRVDTLRKGFKVFSVSAAHYPAEIETVLKACQILLLCRSTRESFI